MTWASNGVNGVKICYLRIVCFLPFSQNSNNGGETPLNEGLKLKRAEVFPGNLQILTIRKIFI